ncbi:MAG: 4-(cytidine 5'-diphospho)-2-C-methyl-D-erythritol kinase [Rudaea sp.]
MNEAWSEWPAPAKVNLFLNIVGRRADGYHLLQTVFQILDWGDRIRIRPRDDDKIVRTAGLPTVDPEKDLAIRAAQLLREFASKPFGADIAIDKRVPAGAGLGGGSSDAATVLVALNRIWKTGASEDELAKLGERLGADVPLFVRGRSAFAEGVGEKLTPIALPERHFVILDPGVHASTAELFQAAELTRNSVPTTIAAFLDGACTGNAFTPLVRARFPSVAAALDGLKTFGDARLSGSGGCVFVAMETASEADQVARACPPEFTVFRATGLNRSPLLDAAEKYTEAR